MIPYIVVFFISIILTYIAERNLVVNKKNRGIVFLVLAILPLSILAGLRSPTLGYDMQLYGINAFNIIDSGTFMQFQRYLSNSILEPGFLIIVFIFDRIYGNINFVLWGLQFLVSVSFIIFAYNYKEKASITFMMFIYECTLYLFTYNILRQSLALALILIMVVLIEKRKYIASIIIFIISMFFHSSAMFAIIVPIILLINDSKKLSKPMKIVSYIISISMLIVMLLFYNNIINCLYSIGIIGNKYVNYLTSSNYRETIDIEFSLLIMKLITILFGFMYFSCKKISTETKNKDFKWFIMLIIDFIITFLSFKLANTDRISWYIYYPALFILTPKYINFFKSDKKNKILGYFIIGSIFLLYFLEKMITNQYKICPYISIL